MTKEEIMRKGRAKFPPDFIEEIKDDGAIVRTDTNATIRHAYIQGLIDNNSLLPSDLDVAAENYSENILANNEDLQDAIEDAFKEGAEWMAKQGITVGGTFHHSSGYPSVIELKTYLREYDGADVIVQVRKK